MTEPTITKTHLRNPHPAMASGGPSQPILQTTTTAKPPAFQPSLLASVPRPVPPQSELHSAPAIGQQHGEVRSGLVSVEIYRQESSPPSHRLRLEELSRKRTSGSADTAGCRRPDTSASSTTVTCSPTYRHHLWGSAGSWELKFAMRADSMEANCEAKDGDTYWRPAQRPVRLPCQAGNLLRGSYYRENYILHSVSEFQDPYTPGNIRAIRLRLWE
ncbi:hypothetical protein FN846DRAFT_989958 [Sphaerosporella brunnea]|uniref:Uncharacterized protein n=1 Tax=Sphaerosporella brunnea TaxID=1250544 RepID=A0A5J5EPW3_9PEZI|nr:hypothetical protein FN846DRAFT_989958 [Sphaerosporella brunnea]